MKLSSVGLKAMRQARKWFVMVFCLVTSVVGHAAVNDTVPLTALKVFAEAPIEVIDMLRPSTRLDMLDYYTQADSILTATNALGGESRFLQVAPDYLKVSVTPVSTLEIKILPVGKKQMVMTLYTTGGEDLARDTEVRFFDSQLRPLDRGKILKDPKLTDFFTLRGSDLGEDDLREKIPFTAVVYTTGPGDVPLTAAMTTLEVISQEDRDLLAPLLRPTLAAPWKGSFKFK